MSAPKKVTAAQLDTLFQRMEKKYPKNSAAIDQFHIFAKAFFTATPCGIAIPALNPALFSQGKALFPFDTWKTESFKLAGLLREKLPELQTALPEREDELVRFADVLDDHPDLLKRLAARVLEKRIADKNGKTSGDKALEDAKVSADLAYFIMFSLLQARAREIAAAAAPIIQDQSWSHGHCPVCGSPAKFSYLWEPNGARYLVCSLCEHHYRFSRSSCPYCETNEPGSITLHYLPDYKEDRAEACAACKRFILASDLRGRDGDVPLAAYIPCSLVHLDIMMLKSKFVLGCEC